MTYRRWVPDAGQERTVAVVGVGRAKVSPDTAVLTLGVRTQQPSPGQALQACSEGVQSVTEAVRPLVAGSQALQSGQLRVRPEYEHGPKGQHLLGYVAEASLRVRSRQLDDMGRIASAALEAAGDAGVVHGLALVAEDTGAAETTARERAVADARSRAEQYASLAGSRIGGLLELSELPGTARRAFRAAAAPASANFMPVEPGEFEIAAQVFVTWALLD
jgi:uncharacterized protein YggE